MGARALVGSLRGEMVIYIVGKSAAAVKLALQFHGEIINADALQLYKGLDFLMVHNQYFRLEYCDC